LRAPLWITLALAFIGTLSLACNRVVTTPRTGARANVVLVTIDTLRADHVGAYGASRVATPTLDAIAREGARFETAIAVTPLTLPSHASILTGRIPPRTGVRHNGMFRLEEDEQTLAERLQAEGYATGAFVGAFVLDARFGLAQGFDHYDDETSSERSALDGYPERRAGVVTDRALAWLEEGEGPFFLWVHYYDPHHVYRAPSPWAERYPEHPYAAEVAYVDAELARLLKGVEQRAPADATHLIVTSDHGESLGEHDETTHSYTLYDAATRIPLLWRGPGVPAGSVVSGIASQVDVVPSLLAMLGLEWAGALDGESLVPLLRNGPRAERVAYSEALSTGYDLGWSPVHAVRSPRFRYVRAPRPELYDLTNDPDEVHNLLEAEPERFRSQARRLDAHIEAALSDAREASHTVDAETLEKLGALGYALVGAAPTATGIDPKDGLPVLQLLHDARHAYQADDFERALALLAEAREQMPEASRVYELLGLIHLHRGRPDLALEPMQRATELSPRDARNRAMLGEIQQQLGRSEAALTSFRAALTLDPRQAYAHAGLLADAVRRGDHAAAERHATQALAEAREPMVRLKVARAFSSLGQAARARALLEEVLSDEPDLAYAHMLLAIELAGLGLEPQSDAARLRAGALASDPALATRLALAHARAGDLSRAETSLREVLGRHPDHEPARRGLAAVQSATSTPQRKGPATDPPGSDAAEDATS
jgi:arylsulfatase A-like enzyme/Flp pilus assembly protein TadD